MSFLPNITKQEEISKQNNTSDLFRKPYDYFSTKIPKSHIEMVLKVVKDERFLFFIKYGLLRRYDGDCEIIYVEIPQIPNKLVIYRRPCIRMKSPEKFYLGNRDLPHIPLFEGEENLKVLSLEMNQITKIDQLISLSNLSYLNLYCNKIKEIENLQTTSHLRVLLLGKNLIEKIKNLHVLPELEILDLHSNQIKVIENLSSLRKLRILNIANNEIWSIGELMINRSLEELNARKNLICSLPNLSCNTWEKMRKINLGKNSIDKVESLNELMKLKGLVEVSLEENPVVLIKECTEILRGIPKVNMSFSHKNNNANQPQQNVLLISGKNDQSSSIRHTRTSSPRSIVASSQNKINHTNSLTCVGIGRNNNNSNALISKDQQYSQMNNSQSILKSIQAKWEFEYDQMQKYGYNGYNNKKVKEAKAMFGHIDYSNDKTTLTCYGDVSRVLCTPDVNNYQHVTSISFNYFYFDVIMNRKHIGSLKQFSQLRSIAFADNNIHSFFQLIKLENLTQVESVSITNNEVCVSGLMKYFLVYRLENLKRFNEENISEGDVEVAKGLFDYFDRCISYCEARSNKDTSINCGNIVDSNANKGENNNTMALSESIEVRRISIGNNGKEEYKKEEKNSDYQGNKTDGICYDDKSKMKVMSYIKHNLDIVINEIVFELLYDE